jgi:enamine deaminase RidA (YjgF/YER057c/UK114 family)
MFVGGQSDLDPAGAVLHAGDLLAQADACMAHVANVVATLGGRAGDIVKLNVFYVGRDLDDEIALMRRIRAHVRSPIPPVISLVRLPRLTEWQHAVDNTTNRPLRNELHRLQKLSFRAHERSEQRQMPVEHVPQIRPRIEATRRPTRHEPSIVFEGRDRSGPGRGAGVFHVYIDSAALSQSLHFLRPVVASVVDSFISAEIARFREFFVSARGRDHACPAQFRNLNRD